MRKTVYITRGAVLGLIVSWLAVAVAVIWLAFISHDLQVEKAARQHQDAAATRAIESLLHDLIVNTTRLHLPGYRSRRAVYQHLYDQLRAGGGL